MPQPEQVFARQPETLFAPLPIDAVWAIEPAAFDRIREGLLAARGGFVVPFAAWMTNGS